MLDSGGRDPRVKDQYTRGSNATTALGRSADGLDTFLPAVGDEAHIMIELAADRPLYQS